MSDVTVARPSNEPSLRRQEKRQPRAKPEPCDPPVPSTGDQAPARRNQMPADPRSATAEGRRMGNPSSRGKLGGRTTRSSGGTRGPNRPKGPKHNHGTGTLPASRRVGAPRPPRRGRTLEWRQSPPFTPDRPQVPRNQRWPDHQPGARPRRKGPRFPQPKKGNRPNVTKPSRPTKGNDGRGERVTE